MASAFSTPREYAPYQEQYNKELLAKAMMYKQGKYDFNKQKINQTIQNLTGLDIARDVDQEYLNNKLQGVLNVINQYGMGDLSLDDRTDYLSSYIANVADDNVMNAYMGTMTLRSIQKQAEQARKEGKYSDRNYAYSMQDMSKWLENPEVGVAYEGNKNYVPYEDENAALTKTIKELHPDAYLYVDPDTNKVTYRKRSGEILSAAKIKAALELTVASNPNLRKQFEVNAWWEFRNMSDAEFLSQSSNFIPVQNKIYNDNISSLKKSLIGLSPSSREYITTNEQIKLLTAERDNFLNSGKISNRSGLEYNYYKTNLLNKYAEAYQYTKTTDFDIITDNAKLAQLKQSFERGSKAADNFLNIFYKENNPEYARTYYEQNKEAIWQAYPSMAGKSFDQVTTDFLSPSIGERPLKLEDLGSTDLETFTASSLNEINALAKDVEKLYQNNNIISINEFKDENGQINVQKLLSHYKEISTDLPIELQNPTLKQSIDNATAKYNQAIAIKKDVLDEAKQSTDIWFKYADVAQRKLFGVIPISKDISPPLMILSPPSGSGNIKQHILYQDGQYVLRTFKLDEYIPDANITEDQAKKLVEDNLSKGYTITPNLYNTDILTDKEKEVFGTIDAEAYNKIAGSKLTEYYGTILPDLGFTVAGDKTTENIVLGELLEAGRNVDKSSEFFESFPALAEDSENFVTAIANYFEGKKGKIVDDVVGVDYNVLSDNIILTYGDKKLPIPRNLLNPGTTAYNTFSEQAIAGQQVISNTARQNTIFSGIQKGSSKPEPYIKDSFEPIIDGTAYKFDVIGQINYTKISDGSKSLQPQVVVNIRNQNTGQEVTKIIPLTQTTLTNLSDAEQVFIYQNTLIDFYFPKNDVENKRNALIEDLYNNKELP